MKELWKTAVTRSKLSFFRFDERDPGHHILDTLEQGWKFISCSQCQELGQPASCLLIGCTRVNDQSEAGSASWPNSWPWLKLKSFRFRNSAKILPKENPPNPRWRRPVRNRFATNFNSARGQIDWRKDTYRLMFISLIYAQNVREGSVFRWLLIVRYALPGSMLG